MDGRNEKGQFIKGRVETTEEEIKRANAMRDAWKKKDNYIGDLVAECPRLYNSWRAFMFNKKGKSHGHSEDWSDFKTFYNDTRSSYQPGFVFRRIDITKPYSKDNFIWVSSEEAKNMANGRTIQIEYNGETHTIRDWSDKLGISATAIKMRYYKHRQDYTVEEILYGKKTKRGSKIVKDVNNENVNVRAKASKMISSYKCKDIKNGVSVCDIDINWMINNILTKPCTYCGDVYRIGCDRIDNSKGHTKDNVVPCCIECNTARNNYFTYEEMKRLGQTIREIKNNRKLCKT